MKELLELFLTFAKIGVMTFGGGMAMLPILEREVVQNKHWATEEELVDYFAIGQCTPGIIAVNTATFVGQKRKARWAASPRRWRGIPLARHYHDPGGTHYELCPPCLGAERLCRHSGVCMRAHPERCAQAAEKVGRG